MKALFSESEVRKETLSLLVPPDCVFEIRALDAKLPGNYRTGIVSGYFEMPMPALLSYRNSPLQRASTSR